MLLLLLIVIIILALTGGWGIRNRAAFGPSMSAVAFLLLIILLVLAFTDHPWWGW
jgi:hypothetical protein